MRSLRNPKQASDDDTSGKSGDAVTQQKDPRLSALESDNRRLELELRELRGMVSASTAPASADVDEDMQGDEEDDVDYKVRMRVKTELKKKEADQERDMFNRRSTTAEEYVKRSLTKFREDYSEVISAGLFSVNAKMLKDYASYVFSQDVPDEAMSLESFLYGSSSTFRVVQQEMAPDEHTRTMSSKRDGYALPRGGSFGARKESSNVRSMKEMGDAARKKSNGPIAVRNLVDELMRDSLDDLN